VNLVFVYFTTREGCILDLFIYSRLPWCVCRLKTGQTHLEYLALSVFQLETSVYVVYNKASKVGIYDLLCTGNDRQEAVALLRCVLFPTCLYVLRSGAVSSEELLAVPKFGMCSGSPRAVNVRLNEHSCIRTAPQQTLTLRRLMTYIYMSYRTANLQTLHFIYLVNKYTY
jgi:hypothetical protein